MLVDDTTTEAMPGILNENPYGVLVAKDELSGFFASLDAYNNTKGKDGPFWLSSYNASSSRVDRKHGGRIYVERPLVSITGTIQPAIFKSTLIGNKSGDGEYIENGMAARFVLASPPVVPKTWATSDVPKNIRDAMETLACKLVWLRYERGIGNSGVIENEFDDFGEHAGDPFDDQSEVIHSERSLDENGRPDRITLILTPDAIEVAEEFVTTHGKEAYSAKGPLSTVWPKLEEIAFRVALVLHIIDEIEADKKRDDVGPVTADAVCRGIRVARWFGHEARRLYSEITNSKVNEVDTKERDVLAKIREVGGATSTEIVTKHRLFRKSGDATKMLTQLVNDGKLVCEVKTGGKGKPPTIYRINTQ